MMAWASEGRLTVIVHGPKNPSSREWEQFLAETVARSGAGQAAGRRRPEDAPVVLVVSHGGVPDGGQRMQLAKVLEHVAAPTAIMTDSPLMLSIARLLTFFNPRQKAVSLRADDAAFDFLGLSVGERAVARRMRAALETELELG